jgi:signal transduction histidine kinase/ActR/RegA family two-component response regulator
MRGQNEIQSLFERRFQRERGARKQAEHLLEEKSRELYSANEELRKLAHDLERLVEERTAELKDARDEALAASRAKSAFLANMSHEIRTPMSGVIGMAELVLGSSLTAEQRMQVGVILESSKSLLTVINDILDLSKLESGKFRLEIDDFDLFELLDKAVDILAIPASEKRLELTSVPAEGLPTRLRGDVVRLRQVLLNLLGNAVKFTDRGGVTLKVEAEERGANNVLLRFEVVDTGPGIAEEGKARLFSKFSQLEGGRARRHYGTGLGLAISKSLVELMDGEIGLDSEPGRGSRFWFKVVLEKQEIAEAGGPPVEEGLRVVMLITNPFLRASAIAHLQMLCADVETVETADALVAATRDASERGNPFQLLLVDRAGLPESADAGILRDALQLCAPETCRASLDWLNSCATTDADLWDVALQRPLTRRKLLDAVHPPGVPRVCVASIGDEQKAATGRVLLVEDVLALQLVAKAMMERLGYGVDVVGDGGDAIEALRRADYGLILMDIQLPRMDGISATKEIRRMADPLKAGTTIIALTANAMKGDEEEYLAAGMNGYLTKPIDNRQLEATLSRWLAED